MTRVLLTGANGFIGTHVHRALLAGGCEVSTIALPECDLNDADAVDRAIEKARPEVCIHLAWYAAPGKYLHAAENLALVGATLRLAQRLRQAGCKRFVGAGTCFEYDTSLGVLSESSATAPASVYAASKLAVFQVLERFVATSGPPMSFAWTRFFYQYGPGEPEGRLVPHILRALSRGKTADVTPGEQLRDFLHVADVAAAVVAVMKSDLEGAVNIGSGVPVTVKDLVLTVAKAFGASDKVRLGAIPYREGDPMVVCANVDKLRTTGFRPRFDLESGLIDTVKGFCQ